MKRRSFFSTITAAVLVLGFSALEARASSVTLDTLIGKTVIVDNCVSFTFNGYTNTGGAPDASAVAVTFFTEILNGVKEYCFTLNGAFGAIAGQNSDADLVYTVAAVSGCPPIVDALLSGNPTTPAGGTGFASVSETLHQGAGILGPVIGSLGIQNPAPLSDAITFAPQWQITVVKDIEARGGSKGVSLSQVTQCFSTAVPEPASLSLLGIGMAGFFAFRQFFKRNALV